MAGATKQFSLLEMAHNVHVALNDVIHRDGGDVPDCDGPECRICAVLRRSFRGIRHADRGRLEQEVDIIVEEMRSKRSRYKSHDLGDVDSVAANTVDDWADRLTKVRSQEGWHA